MNARVEAWAVAVAVSGLRLHHSPGHHSGRRILFGGQLRQRRVMPGGQLRQRRVTLGGPQLPRPSTTRIWTATLVERLRRGSPMEVAEVRSVATFHGPPLTE
jgi:hypothetical protein